MRYGLLQGNLILGKGDDQNLSVGWIKFELPTRHLDGTCVGIYGLKFGGEVQAGDTNLEYDLFS